MRLRLLALLVFAAPLSVGSAFAQSCEKYDPEVVQLTGRLFTLTAYGPPNYGEDPDTDSLETVPVLWLDHPICVDEDLRNYGASPAERDVKSIQLVHSSSGAKFRPNLVGRHISVSGKLFHGISGHHRTEVLMSVDKEEDVPLIARVEVAEALAAARAVGDTKGSCLSQIGRTRASTLVALCRWVSSATHPPCNMVNRCGLIADHILYMCRDDAPDDAVPCPGYGLPPEYARP